MANGSSDTTDVVWQTDSLISVTQAGTAYRFEAYVTTLYPVSVGAPGPSLTFQLGDGTNWVNLGTTTTFPNGEPRGNWYLNYTDGTFNVAGNYYLRLINNQSAAGGNDFAIDSIYFGLSAEAPSVGTNPVGTPDAFNTSGMTIIPNIDTAKASYSTTELANDQVGSTFDGGVLQAASSGTLNNTFVVLETNGTFNTNGYDITLAGNISGPGSFTKTGTGTLTLSNTTDIAAALVNAGWLSIASGKTLIASSGVSIASGATLSGTGTIIGDVTTSGTLAPGNSIGTLNVTGDYIFDTGSEYEVEVDNSGNSDLLAATGDVTINTGSTLKVVSTETITGSQDYTIITASGINGTFTTVNTALLNTSAVGVSQWDTDLEYQTTQVHFTIDALGFNNNSVTNTPLRTQMGIALQEIADDGGNALTTELQSLGTTDLQNAYDQLSGPSLPFSYKVTNDATYKYMGTVSNRMRSANQSIASRFGTSRFYADTSSINVGCDSDIMSEKLWGFWSTGFADHGDREAQGSSSGYSYDTYGTSFGLDYLFTPELLLGLTFGYAYSDLDVAGNHDGTEIESTYFGLYGSYQLPDWYLNTTLVYGYSQYDSRRNISIGSIIETAKGDYKGSQIAASVEAGLNWFENDLQIQPLIGFKWLHEKQDSYNEKGTTNSNLRVSSDSFNSYEGSLGVKLTKPLYSNMKGMKLLGQLRTRWTHELGDISASSTSNFIGYNSTFTVKDNDINRDSAVIGCGLNALLNQSTRLFFDYDLTLNSDLELHLFTAGFEHRW